MIDGAVPIAFYAPLKSLDDPRPSGDRTMARLLLAALDRAGFRPDVASRLRSFEPDGDARRQRAIRDAAWAEADMIAARCERVPAAARPRAWFTYHSYYKAPDWIGPRVAARLGIPYVAAEATRAGKRAGGAWALAHAGVEAGLDGAALVFAVTARDRVALDRDRPVGQAILDLPPFLDAERLPPAPVRAPGTGPLRLLTVAMMRPGDKLASYRLLAESLARLPAGAWTLDVVGDGPARSEVEALLRPFGDAVRLHGRQDDAPALAAAYGAADLFVWPAVNEAYGMVLLEAQAMGCPVVAGRYGGVADAMRAGETGLLSEPGDAPALAAGIRALLDDPARRVRMGMQGAKFVRGERGLSDAAARLRAGLGGVLGRSLAA